MYGHIVLWLQPFSVGNTELHAAYNTDENVNLFLHSGEAFPEINYPQNTDGIRFFYYLCNLIVCEYIFIKMRCKIFSHMTRTIDVS